MVGYRSPGVRHDVECWLTRYTFRRAAWFRCAVGHSSALGSRLRPRPKVQSRKSSAGRNAAEVRCGQDEPGAACRGLRFGSRGVVGSPGDPRGVAGRASDLCRRFGMCAVRRSVVGVRHRNVRRSMTQFLVEQGAKAIVVACNTATAIAVESLRARFALPIVAIEPAVKPAASRTRSRVVGVLATTGTLSSPNMAKLLANYGTDVEFSDSAVPRPGRSGRERRAGVAGNARARGALRAAAHRAKAQTFSCSDARITRF